MVPSTLGSEQVALKVQTENQQIKLRAATSPQLTPTETLPTTSTPKGPFSLTAHA